jgi:uncharacterized protein (DUF58 family)
MTFSLPALGRSRDIRRTTSPTVAPGVYVTAADLAALETAARNFSFLPHQPVHSLLSGRHSSRVRGRGLAFEEMRRYLPGDDIRTMDWHVTARMGEPYVRVYTEEKDRHTLVVVDQRIEMFFGTRRAMKSVAAAEAAALAVWRVLEQGDRVGALVFNDTRIDGVRPERSRSAAMRVLDTIAAQNGELRADSPARPAPDQLNAALDAVARREPHDALVLVISDFNGADNRTRDLLLRVAARNDVIAALVYDPFLLELPESGNLVVTDGELQVELGFGRARARKNILEFADAQGKRILAWQREINVPILPISAAEEPAPQIRRLQEGAVMLQQPAAPNPPPITAAARAALEKLADVAVPPPTPWTPQTWGWAVLAVLLLALAAWLVVRAAQHRRANRYRVEALADLSALESRLQNGGARADAVAAMPALLKRVALAAWPRPNVAPLSGRAWIAFLRTHAGPSGLPDEAARLLGEDEYRPAILADMSSADAQRVAGYVRRWIEEHRVRP